MLFEEIKACTSYIQCNKCSCNKSVQERVQTEREVKGMLQKMKARREDLLEESRHQDTLENISIYDKGGKTYITDDLFEFFVATGSLCTNLYSDENYHQHKDRVLQYAWNALLQDKELKDLFQSMYNGLLTTTTCTSSTSEQVDSDPDSDQDHSHMPVAEPIYTETTGILHSGHLQSTAPQDESSVDSSSSSSSEEDNLGIGEACFLYSFFIFSLAPASG